MTDSQRDISFNEQLTELKSDINDELIAVRSVLRLVAAECELDPAEDDTVLVEIQKVGTHLWSAWDKLCGTFSEVSEKIGDIIGEYHKTATKHQDNASNMNTSL